MSTVSEPEYIPSPYLNFWEAANLLAFGVAAEDAGQQWCESQIKKAGLELENTTAEERKEFEEEEMRRFLSAKKHLKAGARAGRLQVSGRRRAHSELKLIPQLFWENAGVDVLDEDGGGAHPRDFYASDYRANEWVGLRFVRVEVEALQRQIIQGASTGEGAGTAPTRKRKTDTEKDAKLRNRIEAVLAAARNLSRGSNNPISNHAIAKELERTHSDKLVLGFPHFTRRSRRRSHSSGDRVRPGRAIRRLRLGQCRAPHRISSRRARPLGMPSAGGQMIEFNRAPAWLECPFN